MKPLCTLLLLTACTATASPTPATPSQAPAGFWEVWGDGKAEVSGYTLTQSRYGSERPGEAVLVFVTETFTHDQRVKSDGGHRDTFPVLKLNEVRDFQTGIYDYNVMTSAFVPLSGELPRGLATKVTFSMQEWCGSTHAELTAEHKFGEPVEGLRLYGHGYFDGEARVDRALDTPPGGVTADALPVLVRGLSGPLVEAGGEVTVPFLPRLADSRMRHEPLDWTEATIRRSADTEPVTVPAGTFDAYTVTVTPREGSELVYSVEAVAPHRLVRWERADGEVGALTGGERMAYWQLTAGPDASMRAVLGLPALRWPE
jgi:hypothetical protein